jgi:SAM-dependent methyltransferase
MKGDSTFTKNIAADWREGPYYAEAEGADWLGIFWDKSSLFKSLFDSLDLQSVLEIACGQGRHAAQFLERAGTLTLLDVNQFNIDFCKERFRSAENVQFVVNDGSTLAPLANEGFTAVYSYDAMVHFEFEDVISYIKEVRRVLKPGGRALLHMSDYTDAPGALYQANPHWRNFMCLEAASHVGQRAGLSVVRAARFPWGGPDQGAAARDCVILFERTPS